MHRHGWPAPAVTGLVILLALFRPAPALDVHVSPYATADFTGCYGGTIYEPPPETLYFTYDDSYFGPGLRLEVSPLSFVGLRVQLAEIRVLSGPGAGGYALALGSGVGFDVTLEPPVTWRARPYLWGGGMVAGYLGTPATPDYRFALGPDIRIRAGIGTKVNLRRGPDLFAELGIYDHQKFGEMDEMRRVVGYSEAALVGLASASVGMRFPLRIRPAEDHLSPR